MFFWLRNRDFPGATAPVASPINRLVVHVGKNSPPDCFLPKSYGFLPPGSNPYNLNQNKRKSTSLRMCFSLIWLRNRDFYDATAPVASPINRLVAHVGKNSPLDCFLPKSCEFLPPGSNPLLKQKKNNPSQMMSCSFG